MVVKTERTFREVLVDIDSSAVTEILIYPKSQNHKEVKLFKDKDGWRVTLVSGGSAKVADQRITSLFGQLLAIKPKRLAARDESKWNELQVDRYWFQSKSIRRFKISIGFSNWKIFFPAAQDYEYICKVVQR